jgi:hypothetical protein
VYEHEVRTQLAREHAAQLHLDMAPQGRRRPLLRIPVRLSRRFALEPKTRCREVSSRA